jgi:hypothetical protein
MTAPDPRAGGAGPGASRIGPAATAAGSDADRHGGQRGHEAGEVRPRRPDDLCQRVAVEGQDKLAQDLDDRGVRETTLTQVGTVAAQDAHPASIGSQGDVVDKSRLADPGLAGDEQVGRVAWQLVERAR